jgi:GR25 family glycosyltransferase involved in LPS biosynthesis
MNKKMIDKIFICHHKPLIERKEKVQKFFIKNSIDVEWVDGFLPEDIENQYDKIVGKDDLKINFSVPGVQQNQYTLYENAGRIVTIPELSLYLKHQYCFQKQIEEKYDYILILEDDIILPDNFLEYLNFCMVEFINHQPKLDCLILGSCFGFKSQYIQPNKLVHYGPNQLTRCTHSMVFSLSASNKIIKNLYPINWPIDFKLNEIIIKEKLKVAWSEPSLQQASHLNLDKSAIQL